MYKIESVINKFLTKMPFIKKIIKRLYQITVYIFSKKLKKQGDFSKINPADDKEYFFGYYDVSPWDKTGRYLLSLRVHNTRKDTAPKEPAEIVIFDTGNNNDMRILAKTNAWNIQQGCMLNWLGPKYDKKIIYNDFRNNNYCSIILNIRTGEEKQMPMPIYAVSDDGKFALTLDFSRLHRLRKGYGYSNKKEKTRKEKVPNAACIWKVDLKTGGKEEIFSYKDFYNFENKYEMVGAEHKVNHIMINPSGTRFMVLHRWLKNGRKTTRLVTADIDGKNLYNLSDDGMISHCIWKNDSQILAYGRKQKEGNGYFLFNDKTQKYASIFEKIKVDGHPSYSKDKKSVITDTYPNRKRISTIYLLKDNKSEEIIKVFSPFKYDNDYRCDLHPRWNRNGRKICFDSVFEGKRNIYVKDIKKRGSV